MDGDIVVNVEYLLNRFKNGMIPTQDDYKKLIEYSYNNIDENFIDARNYGFIPDNVFDNKELFESILFNDDYSVLRLSSGIYNTSKLHGSVKNKTIKGIYGKTTISTSFDEILSLYDSENIIFEDIKFISVGDNDGYGLISSNDSLIKNITFNRCTFSTPTSETNGIKFINEHDNSTENIQFNSCDFVDIGRMGVEIQNHNDELAEHRYSNFFFRNCTFNNIGMHSDDGMAISMSGLGTNVTVDSCNFKDVSVTAIEFIGVYGALINNCNFENGPLALEYCLIGITNFRVNSRIIITSNRSNGAFGIINIYNSKDIIFSNNILTGIESLYLKDVSKSTFIGNIISTDSGYCLFLDNSFDNTITSNFIDNVASPFNNSVIHLYGENSYDNYIYGNTLRRSSGGVIIVEADGAVDNKILTNVHDYDLVNSSPG